MIEITAPGIYNMPAEDYHAHPSLSKSGVGALVDECPAKYWWDSPHNPEREREEKKAFDIGNAAHLIMLEPAQFATSTVVIEADSYRSKDAQAARDDAYAAGLTPLLPEHLKHIQAMRVALLKHPIAKNAFGAGHAERSHFHRDERTGVWLKARPDFESANGQYVVDYKTTGSANPRDFVKRVFDQYYFVQQPWYLDAIEATTGKRPPNFYFVAQETKPPYLVSVFELDGQAVEWGKRFAARAIQTYAECLRTNNWPGYRDPQHPQKDRTITLTLPSYASYQLIDRDEQGEFMPDKHRGKGVKRGHLPDIGMLEREKELEQ